MELPADQKDTRSMGTTQRVLLAGDAHRAALMALVVLLWLGLDVSRALGQGSSLATNRPQVEDVVDETRWRDQQSIAEARDRLEVGWPAMVTFTPPEMGADPHVFYLAQDRRDLMYAALPRERAVLVYDAVRWRKIQLEQTPLSLVIEEETDRLWVGSYADVGYIELGEPGFPYVSLADEVGEPFLGDRLFHSAALWNGKPVFLDHHGLLIWNGEGFDFIEQAAVGIQSVQGSLWVRARQEILEMTSNGLIPIPWSKGLRVEAVAWLGDDRLLVVGGKERLWVLEDGQLEPWKVGAAEALAGVVVTSVVSLPDGQIAFATNRQGVFLADRWGRVETQVGEAAGLTSVIIRGLFVDRLGQLWMYHRNGLSRLDTAEPVTFFGSSHRRIGKAQAITRHEGRVYLLTVYGGYFLEPGDGVRPARFEPLAGLGERALRAFVRVGERLLVIGDGLFEVKGRRAIPIAEEMDYLMALVPTAEKEVFVAGLEQKIVVLEWKGNDFRQLVAAPLDFREPYSIFRQEEGVYWIVTQMHRLLRVRFPDGHQQAPVIEDYESLGMGPPRQWLGGGELRGSLAFWSSDGVFRPTADGMVQDALFDGIDWEQEVGRYAPRTLIEDGGDGFFMVRPDGVRYYVPAPSGGLEEQRQGGFAVPPGLRSAAHLTAEKTVLWLGHDYGVARLDLESKDRVASRLAPLILTDVRSSSGVVTEAGLPFSSDQPEPIELHSSDGVRFTFSFPLYVDEELIEYRHMLIGYETEWSPWSFEAVKDYNGLPGGDYTFTVQTRRFRRGIGQLGEQNLRVLPYWHKKLWARLLGLLLLAGLVRLLFSLRLRHLRLRTAQLEEEVAARTKQVEVEKQFVEQQARALEVSNTRLRQEMDATRRAVEERIELEEKLQQSHRLESLGALAGGVAHDFNNLLVGIIGSAELALSDLPSDDRRAEQLLRIVSAGEHAADLCMQMLAYAGRAPVVARPFDLNQVVAEMQPLLKSSTRNIDLELELGVQEVASIGDRSQIGQVLLNLVINAAEAVGDSSDSVIIRTGMATLSESDLQGLVKGESVSAGDFIYLEVEDSGEGMSQETKDKLFEPFFTTKFVGRGLGLSTVFGIVSRHEGALEVETKLGSGARFRSYFPVREAVQELPAESTVQGVFRRSGLVMVIDDEPLVYRVASDILDLAGFEVAVAKSGQEAIEFLRAHPDDVLLAFLDLSMPGMDGAETLGELRQIRLDLPVVVMSGLSEPEVMAQFKQTPPHAFVQKPFKPDDIFEALRRVLGTETPVEP